MKKLIITALAVSLALGLQARDLLRYNYTRNGYTYTGCEREKVEGSRTLYVKLSRVLFSDGQPVYVLRLDVEDSSPWKMPKNAPLTLRTTDDRTVIVKNSASEPNRVAPDGIQGQKGKVWWNYGEYYLEESDLKKLSVGIASVDITTRWSADGYVKVAYKNNEFGSVLAAQYEALRSAPKPSTDVAGVLKSIQDRGGSRLSETNVLKVNDKLSLSLVYFYYAATNTEGYDLNLYINGVTVPYGAEISILSADGRNIVLHQEKDLSAGRAICYPEAEDIRSILSGVRSLTVQTTGVPVVLTFENDTFRLVFDRLYNSLQTISIL